MSRLISSRRYASRDFPINITRMNRAFLSLLILSLISGCAAQKLSQMANPPNVIILLTDDQGYNDLGCYGSPLIETPNIDRMAREGMRFTDYYVAAPLCTPSRAALMTGCYPQRVSMASIPPEPEKGRKNPQGVLFPGSGYGLNPHEVTIAQVLKSRGYATRAIGKWHLGDAPEFSPLVFGFDHYFGIPYSNDMKPSPLMRDRKQVEEPANQDTLVDRYTADAVSFIHESREKPFFLYLAYNSPHVPVHAPDRFRGRSPRGIYGDAIETIDWSAGRIFDALTKDHLDRNTIVLFTSDNGPWLSAGEDGGSATPLRAGKGTTYDGAMRVPFIARWPGQIPAGKVNRELVTEMDFLPTVAAISGTKAPADRIIDGHDIRALLFDEPAGSSPTVAFFYYQQYRLNAVRCGVWKLKFRTNLSDENTFQRFENPDTPIPEALYNLFQDPGEQKSVLRDHPEIVKKLRDYANKAREDLGDARQQKIGKNLRPIGHINTPSTNPSAAVNSEANYFD
jgi:arylsulfatase A